MDLNLVIARFKTDRDTLEINDIQYISSAVLFLSSNDSSYITGSNIYVDGGWSAI